MFEPLRRALAQPGHVEVKALWDDCEYAGYWEAFVGDTRVNGGVCTDYTDGMTRGRKAIDAWRKAEFHATHYWDVETGQWYKKGELPPVVP